MRLRAFAIALALAPGAPALAELRQADQTSGTLEFQATQAGAKFTGAFTRFRVTLDFDPARPGQGRLEVAVDIASIDTQDAERDEILRSPDFFWVEQHPEAVFRAARFERAGDGWRAPGELTIRGAKQAVPVTFTLTGPAGRPVMQGSARIRRLDFGLGQGDWASTEWVGDDVDVRFELALGPPG